MRVFEREPDVLVAECEVEGDTFGAETSLSGSDLTDVVVVDELVEGIARLVWHELLGTPVFRDEDAQWTDRVAIREAWASEPRTPTLGYIVQPEPESEPEPEPGPEGSFSATVSPLPLGDVDASRLEISEDEMVALTRGEVVPSLLARVLEARSTANLIETAYEAVQEALSGETGDLTDLARASAELREVLRRFDHPV